MSTIYQDRKLVAPVPNAENGAYFTAAAAGKLLIKKCRACGEPHFYPRALCPHCFSSETEWIEASGRGTIYSFSVSRKVGPTPFAIAFVTLAEGVSMMTNIVDVEPAKVKVGQKVKVVFKPTDNGGKLPCFTPA